MMPPSKRITCTTTLAGGHGHANPFRAVLRDSTCCKWDVETVKSCCREGAGAEVPETGTRSMGELWREPNTTGTRAPCPYSESCIWVGKASASCVEGPWLWPMKPGEYFHSVKKTGCGPNVFTDNGVYPAD